MEPIRYVITHDSEMIERYAALAHRLLPEAGVPAPRGLRERAARVGAVFPLLALDGDEVVGGVCPMVRDAHNQDLLLPEEEGTRSRLLGSHPLLTRRFVWANHACVEPRYQGAGVFRELCMHILALARVFHVEAVGYIGRAEMVRPFQAICRRYVGVRGDVVELAFDLPTRYRESNAIFFLVPTRGASVSMTALQRVRAHCERHGIRVPA